MKNISTNAQPIKNLMCVGSKDDMTILNFRNCKFNLISIKASIK
jgi:hypothetical protein